MNSQNDKLFYVGQKAFIEHNGKVLILFNKNESADIPGGKIQEGETDLPSSLKREIQEETGLEVDIVEPFFTWTFTLPSHHTNAGHDVYLVGFYCRIKDDKVMLSDAHTSYKWVDKDNFKKHLTDSPHLTAVNAFFQRYHK